MTARSSSLLRLFALRVAGLLAVLSSLFVLGGCEEKQRLALEEMRRPAFDPVRWEPGRPPRARGPLPERIVFGITPFYSPERQAPALARLADYLHQQLGIEVETKVATTYREVVDELASGRVDVAQLSPYAYVQATRQIDDLLPLAASVAQGTTSYASYLIVKATSPYQRIDDVLGKRLGFTDRWSTSGYIVPSAWLRTQGLDPQQDFKVVWLGSHDKALRAVIDGEVEAAAVSSDTVVSTGVIGLGGPVRILAKPGRIPYDAVVVRETMDPLLVWKVRKAFLSLSIHTAPGRAVLEDYNLINGFMPIPEGHYSAVRSWAESEAKRADR
jgi:phosphonate transport system substrate-binding protein